MATWTYEVATEYNFPNITVYRKYRDGVHASWRFVSNEGYVMYDTTAVNVEPVIDPATGMPMIDPTTGMIVEREVTYYYTSVDCTLNYPFHNFTWVAVPRDSVDENYIFGVDEPEHEVM